MRAFCEVISISIVNEAWKEPFHIQNVIIYMTVLIFAQAPQYIHLLLPKRSQVPILTMRIQNNQAPQVLHASYQRRLQYTPAQ